MKKNYKTLGAAAAMIISFNAQASAANLSNAEIVNQPNVVNFFDDYKEWTSREVYNKIVEIIENQLQCDTDKITPEAHLMIDLGADSLDYLLIVEECCQVFGCGVTEEEYNSIKTVSDLHAIMIHAIIRAGGKVE